MTALIDIGNGVWIAPGHVTALEPIVPDIARPPTGTRVYLIGGRPVSVTGRDTTDTLAEVINTALAGGGS
ncbi:hypothetical protein V2J56_09080 [Georgenia sp. MJ206]|uniref:hypothetical protein n=1 Tax=Georgenia wangjunii TaxID=3117730 RepID=UPI002F267D01